MRLYKITPGADCNSCIEKKAEAALVWLQEASIGEKVTIEIIEMSEEEYEKLPEFVGP